MPRNPVKVLRPLMLGEAYRFVTGVLPHANGNENEKI